MALNKKNKNQAKICPMLDRECLKSGCMLYHEDFERCDVPLLIYNIVALTAETKKLIEKLK